VDARFCLSCGTRVEAAAREARTAARLSHPNIVPLHTFGEANGLLYFVMGYVAGESLADRLQRAGPYEAEAAARSWRPSATRSTTRTGRASSTATSSRTTS
jgi:serine/threonine protein kinase